MLNAKAQSRKTGQTSALTKKPWYKIVASQKILFFMLLPSAISILLFKYAPMFGVYMSFTNYTPGGDSFFREFFSAEFVGFEWFKFFFDSGDFLRIMRNTLATSLLSFAISFPAPIILALLINECTSPRYKKFVQTASYMPYFISWVIVSNMVLTLLSADGAVNAMLKMFGLTQESILFFQDGKYFWWVIAFSNAWKSMGYNSILYLAAMAAINPEYYEAAVIDGATRIQKIWYVTLPAITPTITILLIMSISGLLNAGFDQQMLMMNDSIIDYADVIDTYAYRYGMLNSMFSYSAAVGLFKSVVSFILLITANFTSRKINGNSIF